MRRVMEERGGRSSFGSGAVEGVGAERPSTVGRRRSRALGCAVQPFAATDEGSP